MEGMSEFMSESRARWNRIQDAIAGDVPRQELVRMSSSAFRNAQLAYNASYNGGPELGGMRLAGIHAWLYLRIFEHVRRNLMDGATPKATFDKFQAVSDWLVRMGWNGIPSMAYVGMNAIPLNKNAEEMHGDMNRYHDAALKLDACVAA